ncbi:iron-sulfur cluster biosynthesis family protein [Ammoniphilus sp. 3BR4]|uniref:iron-sulfur cluster biosynthesis family protein n=1 Tax=Ammoniphilus sp. 3BR4 TaxID=3158265 RepID=UPI0034655AA1
MDELNPRDVVYSSEGVTVLIDELSQRELGDKLTIDLTSYGFKLSTPNEILSYNLKLDERVQPIE